MDLFFLFDFFDFLLERAVLGTTLPLTFGLGVSITSFTNSGGRPVYKSLTTSSNDSLPLGKLVSLKLERAIINNSLHQTIFILNLYYRFSVFPFVITLRRTTTHNPIIRLIQRLTTNPTNIKNCLIIFHKEHLNLSNLPIKECILLWVSKLILGLKKTLCLPLL
jgi:hypothetical protein